MNLRYRILFFLPAALLVSCDVIEKKENAYPGLIPASKDYANKFIGLQVFQDNVEQSRFSVDTEKTDAEKLLVDISARISTVLSAVENAVDILREGVEEAFANNKLKKYEHCCDKDSFDLINNSRFQAEIDDSRSCGHYEYDSSSPPLFPTTLEDLAKINLKTTPAIKFQVFQSKDSALTQFPAGPTDACESKIQPHYVSAAAPDSSPKDVVIVIDDTNKWDVIQPALISALQSLRATDRIAIRPSAAFIAGHYFPRHLYLNCDECGLLHVKPKNIHILRKWISALKATGKQASNEDLLKLAFGFECDREHKVNSQRFLLTFPRATVGSDHSSVSKNIQDENLKKDFYDAVISYLIYDGTDSLNLEILSYVGNETMTRDKSYDDWDDSEIAAEIGSFYSFLPLKATDKDVHWSEPHIRQKRSVITASSAVVVNDNYQGVVGTYITLNELLADVVYFKASQTKAYSFVLDKQFHVVFHPLLPSTEDSGFVENEITEIERSPKIKAQLLPKLKAKLVSNASPADDVISEDVSTAWPADKDSSNLNTDLVESKISCKIVNKLKFIICIVVKLNPVTVMHLVDQPLPNAFKFLYHRLDIVKPEKTCSFLGRLSTKASAINLSPRAFKDSVSYMTEEETRDDIFTYENSVTRSVNSIESLITASAINDIRMTNSMEDFWQRFEKSREEDSYNSTTDAYEDRITIWQYVATEGGVLRIWPGIQLPKGFDAAMRPWYKAALEHKSDIVITAPYRDAVTGQVIVSYVQAMMQKGDSTSENNKPYAVVGADLFLRQFMELVRSLESDCIENSCILFDFSGRLLYHAAFWEIDHSKLPGAHLLDHSPDITEELIRSRILVQRDCYDSAKKSIKHSYVVSQDKFERNQEKRYEYDGFFVKRLIGTNILVVVAEKFDVFSAKCEEEISDEQRKSRGFKRCRKQLTVHDCFESSFFPNTDNFPLCMSSAVDFWLPQQEIPENKACYSEFQYWGERDEINLSWMISLCWIPITFLWFFCKAYHAPQRNTGGFPIPMTTNDIVQAGQTQQTVFNNGEMPFAQPPNTSPPSYFESTSFSSAPGTNPIFSSQPTQKCSPGPPQNQQYFSGSPYGTGIGSNFSTQYSLQ